MSEAPAPATAALERVDGLLASLLTRVAANPAELAATLETSSDALIAFDANRRILAANAHAEALFGVGRGGLATLTTDDLIPARMRQPNAPPMVPLADVMRVELPAVRRDGSELAMEWVFASVDTSSGPVFVMVVRDHAATERAVEALRASEERFRLLVEGVHDYAIYMLDANGLVSSWNRGAERNKGWAASEIIGQSYAVFFSPEEREAGVPQQLLARAVAEGHIEVIGWRFRKDGTRFRANASLSALRTSTGEHYGFAKITRDLTDRLQLEEFERLRRLQLLTAALSKAVTPEEVASVVLAESLQAIDAHSGVLYTLSDDGATFELLDQRGLNLERARRYARIASDARTPLTDAARARTPAFFETRAQIIAEYPELDPNLADADFEASAVLPVMTHDRLLGALAIRFETARPFVPSERSLLLTVGELCAQALDRARLFAAESAARAAAEAANRSKDEFLAMLGHELRNPLAPIVTALSLLDLRGDGAFQRERTVIERQVKHLVRLVDDLLDVSRITQKKVQLKRERVELAEIVDRALELCNPILDERKHHLALDVPATGLPVFGDITRLAQVVTNLLTNAAKYTNAGGHIEISARRLDSRVVLTVRDDGAGIAPAMMPHIFDLFAQERQSLERSQGGLGLGLAIVKSLVAMHDGTIEAVSDGHGCGSTFTLELPAAVDRDVAAPIAAGSQARANESLRRVLVVDDNVDAAELMAEVLRRDGHEVVTAHDGPAALLAAQTFRAEVAVLDIGLPVMDGYELARRLREHLGTVRLVALTGYGQADDRARAREAGFDLHMVKPVDIASLRAALLA